MIARHLNRVQRLVVSAVLLAAFALTGCNNVPFAANNFTISDVLQGPDEFVGRDITVDGIYLDLQGDSDVRLTLLVPGLGTSADKDTAPIYAGEASKDGSISGGLWLDNPLQGLDSALRHSSDATWGLVLVSGHLEKGTFGPGGKYLYRLSVSRFQALQQPEWEPAVALQNKVLNDGKVSLFDLADHPADYAGKQVTTQGYYFWSQVTSGLLTEQLEREQGEIARSTSIGSNPRAGGRVIVLEGFPPELTTQLNFGPENTYVWGLIEVTGTLETGGTWGAGGAYHLRLTATKGQVKVLGK